MTGIGHRIVLREREQNAWRIKLRGLGLCTGQTAECVFPAAGRLQSTKSTALVSTKLPIAGQHLGHTKQQMRLGFSVLRIIRPVPATARIIRPTAFTRPYSMEPALQSPLFTRQVVQAMRAL